MKRVTPSRQHGVALAIIDCPKTGKKNSPICMGGVYCLLLQHPLLKQSGANIIAMFLISDKQIDKRDHYD
ncbi:MAG: hypothetical protein CL858_29435 [Cupriavidus sp.]|nr:hypothetical protein [Methylobacterium sp.]MBU69502.1 hypothetical protein [Cupriavidus sp.]